MRFLCVYSLSLSPSANNYIDYLAYVGKYEDSKIEIICASPVLSENKIPI